jgi:hypothetical protein
MFQNPALDIVIGLVFIYLLYSLLATILQEFIATKLAFRSKVLEKAIIRMLEDGKSTTSHRITDRLNGFFHILGKPNMLKGRQVATWFYAHPLIKYLGEDNFYSKPAYLSSKNFSKVLVDLLKGMDANGQSDVQRVNDAVQAGAIYQLPINVNSDLKNPAIIALRGHLTAGVPDNQENLVVDGSQMVPLNEDTGLFLRSLWRESSADLDVFRQKLENWFDDTMDRATGWYKRYTKYILFIIGMILAVGFNIDTIGIVNKLKHSPTLRAQLVESATAYLEKSKQIQAVAKDETDSTAKTMQTKASVALIGHADTLMRQADSLYNIDLKNLNNVMGFGWKHKYVKWSWTHFDFVTPVSADNNNLFFCIIGWLVTALAISLGAPFWFDLLNKMMQLRGTGAKIDSSDDSVTTSVSGGAAAPMAINVNTQTSEEAVG